MFYVYLLKDKKDKIYIGYSDNLKRRLIEHNSKKVYTSRRMDKPQLFYYEAYPTKELARNREKKLKQYGAAFQELKKRLGLK